ncbi:MAG TPA: hypothetical protein VFL91_08530 [Thermomicrobiales bacterium]|nr:hypothetical protein [Thermomicrobiales bacterium]
MEELYRQWPLLGALIVISGTLLKIIQGLYERMLSDREKELAEVKEERDKYRDLAFSGTSLAELSTDIAEKKGHRP